METINHPDSQLIDALGGTAAVASLCEIRMASVSEWRRVGIPKARRLYLAVLRPDIFGPAPTPAATQQDKAA